MIFTTVFILFYSWSKKKHTKIDILCFSCVYFTTVFTKRFLWWANLKIFPRASKPSWIWYDFCQNLMIKVLKENHVDISLILSFLENFQIFLMMKMIEKIVRFWKFLRSSQAKVFIASSSIFIKIREVLLWL